MAGITGPKAFNGTHVAAALIECCPIRITGADADAVDDTDVESSSAIVIGSRTMIATSNLGNSIGVTVGGDEGFHAAQHPRVQPHTRDADV